MKDLNLSADLTLSADPQRSMRTTAENLPLYAPVMVPDPITQRNLLILRKVVVAHRKINVQYFDLLGDTSQRMLWPLGCLYWGAV